MPINYFQPICNISPYKQAKTTSNNNIFGLCDDSTPNSKTPAYIDNTNKSNWIATVINKQNLLVEFYAVDNCRGTLNKDGNSESECDGILRYKTNTLVFVELKNKKSNWLKSGAEQMSITIQYFKQKKTEDNYIIKNCLCNKKHPKFSLNDRVVSTADIELKFKKETGIALHVSTEINID
ncbi:MAG: hypothetical protein ABL940_06460 [Bacteroidia bacterium]